MKWIVYVCFLLLAPGLRAEENFWRQQFEFVNDHDTVVSLKKWSGKQVVVTMDYADCTWICSTAWRKLLEIQQVADKKKIDLSFLVISLDPTSDSPAKWREFKKQKGISRSNWEFVVGSKSTTAEVAKKLAIHWWVYDGHIMHDLKILRLRADGTVAKVITTYDAGAEDFLND